jgi:hypothetical protein
MNGNGKGPGGIFLRLIKLLATEEINQIRNNDSKISMNMARCFTPERKMY